MTALRRRVVPYTDSWAQDEGLVSDIVRIAAQFGGDLFEANGKPLLLEQPAQRAAAFMRRLIDEGLVPAGVAASNEPDAMRAFLSGGVAFTTNWNFVWGAMNDPIYSQIVGQGSVAPIPAAASTGKSAASVSGFLGLSGAGGRMASLPDQPGSPGPTDDRASHLDLTAEFRRPAESEPASRRLPDQPGKCPSAAEAGALCRGVVGPAAAPARSGAPQRQPDDRDGAGSGRAGRPASTILQLSVRGGLRWKWNAAGCRLLPDRPDRNHPPAAAPPPQLWRDHRHDARAVARDGRDGIAACPPGCGRGRGGDRRRRPQRRSPHPSPGRRLL